MVYNLRKKAIGEIPALPPNQQGIDALPPDPLYGVNQGIVDSYWQQYGNVYSSQAAMVEGLGGIDALVTRWNLEGTHPDAAQGVLEQQQDVANRAASVKPFNLKRAFVPEMPGGQVEDPMPPQTMQEPTGASPDGPPWQDHAHFKMWLDNREASPTMEEELRRLGLSESKEAIEFYFSKKREVEQGLGNAEELLDQVNQIFNLIPEIPSLKVEGGEVMSKHRTIEPGSTSISEVEEAIKKTAAKHGTKKKAKSYNLSKTAQHKTLDNAIMWGPGDVRKVDPFLRQPVSDWHIIERNKGFGLVVDDVWNIDYETIWRENIMDKYSRPYRDQEGNWVGGYIQKRFEVDKNIPNVSNMQLKPGQRRRPVLPEYGNTESRLQAARAAGDVAGAVDTSKPFNWKEASSKKKR